MATDGDTADAGVDLATLAAASDRSGVIWTGGETDLNVNLVRFGPLDGAGSVEVDGRCHPLGPGVALVIPRGARRATTAGTEGLAYLTCYRRRAGLWPTGLSRPGTGGAAG